MHYRTGLNVFRPEVKHEALLYDIVLVVGASIFVALGAQVSVPVPLSPVPITGQTFAVLLTGALLGSTRGILAILIYLLEGISGMPVFAAAGFGIPHLLGPTGGYLIGFLPAVYVCGWLFERGWDDHVIKVLIIMILGTVIIFICGLIWLSRFSGSQNVLMMGLYPFIPGAIIKIIVATILLPIGIRILKYWKSEEKG